MFLDMKIPEPARKFLVWFDNAKWYHFWNPGSGFFGGLIPGMAIMLFLLVVMN